MENSKDTPMIDFSRTIYEIKKHWYYYVIAFVLFVGFGTFYMYKKNPVYLFHANMLIEQEGGSGTSSAAMAMMKSFSMAGIGGGSIDDELLVIQSHGIAKEMVKELKLNRQYIDRVDVRNLPLYNNSPVEVNAPDEIFDTIVGVTFHIDIKKNGLVDILVKKGLFETVYEAKSKELPTTVTPSTGGTFVLTKTKYFVPNEERYIIVNVSDNDFVAENYSSQLVIDYASSKSNGIMLELEDNQKQRGLDILNKMFEVYNRRRLAENNTKAISQMKFVDERLAEVTKAMVTSEKELEAFKLKNKITDLAVEAEVLLEQNSANSKSVVEQQTQIAILNMVCNFLEDPQNSYSLIPINTGINNEVAAKAISDYNTLVLNRMQLNASAKDSNKTVKVLDQQIDAMRTGVISTIKNIRDNAKIAFGELSKVSGNVSSRLLSLSENERQFLDLTRNREIQNSLYLFLVEQRESNLLKVGANAPVGRVIDCAYRDTKPIKPKLSFVMALALFATLVFPTLWFIFKTIFAKTIVLKYDVTRFSDASEIEELRIADNDEVDFSLQTRIASEFRTVRNILMKSNPKSLLITSLFEGEGKTFVGGNILKLISNSGKTAVVIDINAEGKISRKLLSTASGNGIVDCLIFDISVDSVIRQSSMKNISIITPGTETGIMQEALANEKLQTILNALKEKFDVVVFISGGVESNMTLPIVSDIVDKTLLVLRSNQLAKPYLKFYKLLKPQLNEDKMMVVVNGIKDYKIGCIKTLIKR